MWTFSKHAEQKAIEHAQLESLIQERTVELQILSQRLLKVQDEERRRLSRDLHDSTGQTLTALKMSLLSLEMKFKQDPGALGLLTNISELADQAISEIRTMSYLLHPPLLDEVGLACAAEWFVEGFAKRSGVSVTLDIEPIEKRLPRTVEIALFRVLQECLTNVQRHSEATAVHVVLQCDCKNVVLEVSDDGKGIASDRLKRLRETSADSGVGLAGMRERVRELCGSLEIESLGKGLRLRATVPTTMPVDACRNESEREPASGTRSYDVTRPATAGSPAQPASFDPRAGSPEL